MPTTTVPLLPCLDADSTVDFYQALGFTVTHRQDRPYLYVALRSDDIEIHFKDASPNLDRTEENSGGFLALVDDVAPLHTRFVDGLRRRYGRMPARGLPRLTRLRPGQTRFCLYDPSGNCVIVVNRNEPDVEYGGSRELSGLAKAHDNARIFRDFKNDDVLAARALDAALRRYRDGAPRLDVARALADRAELAIILGDDGLAARLRAELADLDLTDGERTQLAAELTALEQIEDWVR
jgi:catechol 2,3-dioxygenase-like lactoylglutathione lyase family enzyme